MGLSNEATIQRCFFCLIETVGPRQQKQCVQAFHHPRSVDSFYAARTAVPSGMYRHAWFLLCANRVTAQLYRTTVTVMQSQQVIKNPSWMSMPGHDRKQLLPLTGHWPQSPKATCIPCLTRRPPTLSLPRWPRRIRVRKQPGDRNGFTNVMSSGQLHLAVFYRKHCHWPEFVPPKAAAGVSESLLQSVGLCVPFQPRFRSDARFAS